LARAQSGFAAAAEALAFACPDFAGSAVAAPPTSSASVRTKPATGRLYRISPLSPDVLENPVAARQQRGENKLTTKTAANVSAAGNA